MYMVNKDWYFFKSILFKYFSKKSLRKKKETFVKWSPGRNRYEDFMFCLFVVVVVVF